MFTSVMPDQKKTNNPKTLCSAKWKEAETTSQKHTCLSTEFQVKIPFKINLAKQYFSQHHFAFPGITTRLRFKLSFQDIFTNMLTSWLCACQQMQHINRSYRSHRHHTAEHNGYYKLLAIEYTYEDGIGQLWHTICASKTDHKGRGHQVRIFIFKTSGKGLE